MEEQRKQILEKKTQKSLQKQNDREFFNNYGKQASDVYYINDDKQLDKKSQIKGNAGRLADILRSKQTHEKREK